jgi:hypothetical protein
LRVWHNREEDSEFLFATTTKGIVKEMRITQSIWCLRETHEASRADVARSL